MLKILVSAGWRNVLHSAQHSLRETSYEERTQFHVMDLWTGLHAHTISQNGFCSMGVCEVTSLRRLKQGLWTLWKLTFTALLLMYAPSCWRMWLKIIGLPHCAIYEPNVVSEKMCKQNGTAPFHYHWYQYTVLCVLFYVKVYLKNNILYYYDPLNIILVKICSNMHLTFLLHFLTRISFNAGDLHGNLLKHSVIDTEL